MDFELTPEQQAITGLARDFADGEMAPQAAAWDRDCTFPVETLRRAGALGFAGIYIGEDVGEIGRASCRERV